MLEIACAKGRMRRGISETISTLLTLLIVVALGIAVLSWGNQYISTLRQGVEQQVQLAEDAIKERPIIEHIVINDTGAYIWVRNVGFSELTIDRVYIRKVSSDEIASVEVDVSLDPGEALPFSKPIRITQYNFVKGETYVFTIATKRGVQVSYRVTY